MTTDAPTTAPTITAPATTAPPSAAPARPALRLVPGGAGAAAPTGEKAPSRSRRATTGPGSAGDPVASAMCVLALRLEVATVEAERLLDRGPVRRGRAGHPSVWRGPGPAGPGPTGPGSAA